MQRRGVLTAAAALVFGGCLGGNDAGTATNATGGTANATAGATSTATSTGGTTNERATNGEPTETVSTSTPPDTTNGTERTAKPETTRPTSAAVTDRTFTVEDANADPADEATVRFADGGDRVVITGTITGRDGCRTAALGSVRIDGGALVATVVTERAADAGAVCSEALVGIDYRLVVRLDRTPRSVRVVHRGANDSGTVATATPE